MRRTEAGRHAADKCATENGRNSRTCRTPTFSPLALQGRCCSRAVSAPEPIRIRHPFGVARARRNRTDGSAGRSARAKRAMAPATIAGTRAWKGLTASRAWKNVSGFCAVPRMNGCSGLSAARAMGAHQIVVDHRPDLGVAQQLQRVEFVRGAESVEEMQERHARFQRRHLREQRAIMRLLHRGRAQQREAGGPRRHDVRVVAEDRQRRGRQRARGDMKHRRVQFARRS